MKLLRAMVAIFGAVAGAGCLVQVERVADADHRFKAALDEASRYQGRPGPASELNVLVYDPRDRQMVRVTLPVWFANKIASRIDFDHVDIDVDADLDPSEARLARTLKRRLRRGDFRDLSALPLGVVAQVDDSDGERVLVWMK